MSTRSQILVRHSMPTFNHEIWKQEVMLYRHSDGYPTSVLPALKKALLNTAREWEAGRAGHAAAYIIHESYRKMSYDKGKTHQIYIAVEPESGFALHGDIEYFYVVTCQNKQNGSWAEKNMNWHVQVRVPAKGFRHKKGGADNWEVMTQLMAEGLITELGNMTKAKKIEKHCQDTWEDRLSLKEKKSIALMQKQFKLKAPRSKKTASV